jgi:hypothetical protein
VKVRGLRKQFFVLTGIIFQGSKIPIRTWLLVKDERVKLPLDPQTAPRALLAVDPDSEPADAKDRDEAEKD